MDQFPKDGSVKAQRNWVELKLKNLSDTGHRRPVTRRDFLSHGFYGYAAYLAIPTLPALMARTALADCGTPTDGAIPFIGFDMAGGASIPGNFLVGKNGSPKDLLKSYSAFGWNPKDSGALDERFGLPMSAKYSKILEGILSVTSADAQARFRMGSFCHVADEDTDRNRLNAANFITRAGSRGLYLANGVAGSVDQRGGIDPISGGRSQSACDNPAMRPTIVSSVIDVINSARFGGEIFAGLKPEQLRALAVNSGLISKAQAEVLATQTGHEMLVEMTKCAYEKNPSFVGGVDALDSRRDTDAQLIYGINQATAPNVIQAVESSVTMNAIRGYTGPGVWTLGNCDYHNGTQTLGDAQDRSIGVSIGRAVELAHRIGKKLFIQLFTDGSAIAQAGTRNWTSEGDTTKGMTIIGLYNPDGAPKYYKDRMQVGSYTDGQGADTTTVVGASPFKVACAVVANYLHVSGKLDQLNSVVGNVFKTEEIDQILIFDKPSV